MKTKPQILKKSPSKNTVEFTLKNSILFFTSYLVVAQPFSKIALQILSFLSFVSKERSFELHSQHNVFAARTYYTYLMQTGM